MYHISNDKRARKSAELIWDGMKRCLHEKTLDKLRITDLYEASYVSRATFYRLFDSVEDVLLYECDQIYAQLADELEHSRFHSKREVFIYLIEKWLAQDALIQALVENNKMNLVYEVHMNNRGLMKDIFLKNVVLPDCEADYLTAVLAYLIPAAISVWYLHGKRENAEDIFNAVRKSTTIISRELRSV